MKKGLLFIIVLALIYWAIRYTTSDKNGPPPSRPERDAPGQEYPFRKANIQMLEANVEIFRHIEDRPPHTLWELVEKGYIEAIPDDGGEEFKYDPNTGRVE